MDTVIPWGGHLDTTAQPAPRQGGEGMVIQLCLSSAVCLSLLPKPLRLPRPSQMLLSVKPPSHSVPLWSPPLCRLLFRMIFQGTHFICNPLMSSPSQLQPLPPAALGSGHLAFFLAPLMELAPLPLYLSGLNFLSPQLFLFKETASLRYNLCIIQFTH